MKKKLNTTCNHSCILPCWTSGGGDGLLDKRRGDGACVAQAESAIRKTD